MAATAGRFEVSALVPVPGGTVRLKDARRGTERTVNLQPFRAGAMAVTAAQFAAGELINTVAGMDLPAAGIRWIDAVRWCNAASEHDGLEPVYAFDRGAVCWNPRVDGYRLPTEAEWVHASMGGGSGARHGTLTEVGWSAADGVTGPQPVGGKAANGYGLFDTLGNVWEWCWDRLDPARYADYRVFKGGGWADPGFSCRVGVRRGNAPDASVEDVGFRVFRGAVAPAPETHGAQGWSERADRERAAIPPPLPAGWTPLHFDQPARLSL